MSTIVHGTKEVKETGSFASYKFLATCLCGWETRMASKEQAESSLQSHLANFVDTATTSPAANKPPAPKMVDGKPTGTWRPAGASVQQPIQPQSQSQSSQIKMDNKQTSSGLKPLGSAGVK